MKPHSDINGLRLLAQALVTTCLLAVGACAERGDFDRPKETALSLLVSPIDGPTNASFQYTDDEQELRDRAWRFLMPAKQRSYFDRLVYDAARSGYLPPNYFPEKLSWYHDALIGEAFRSPSSRYTQLVSDISADRLLLSAFAHVAAQVFKADELRARAAKTVADLRLKEWNDASIRIQENRALIGWVCYRASMRLQGYRYALEHAYVAMPQLESLKTERILIAYENDFEPLRISGCISRDPWRNIHMDRGIRIPPDGHFFMQETITPIQLHAKMAPSWRIVKN
ncbi:MAG: hypothetical protein ACRCTD_04460 [Beijerinckiaceae bacterium]